MTTQDALPATAHHATRPRSERSVGLRLALLFGPSIFGVSAAGVALPAASAALRIGPASAAWILTAHALALGVGTALFGRLHDALGVRRTLLLGSAVLTAGTLVCLLAPDLGTMVAGRLVLAAGSGAMTSAAVTVTATVDPARRPGVLAWFGAAIAVFAGVAPLVGGASAALSWRIALVLPALSLVGVPASLRLAPRAGLGGRVDMMGAALLTALAAAVLVLPQAPNLRLGTAPLVALAVVALAAAGALGRWVRRHPAGFVPRALLTNHRYLAACAVGAGVFGGLFGAMYAVPRLLADHGWSPTTIGAVLLPGAMLGAVTSRLAGRLTPGGGRRLLALTAAASGLDLASAGLTGGPVAWLVAGASLAFTAFALTQVVLTGQVATVVAADQRGAAMGLLNLTFLVGGALGSAIAGGLTGPLGSAAALAGSAVLPLAAALGALAGGTTVLRAAHPGQR
jgi:MFS transporter, DHA2 family, metal-tetracycline-proton antiporter